MTPEELQQIQQMIQGAVTTVVTPLGEQVRGISTALETLRNDPAKVAADKAAADKAAADKAAADAAAAAKGLSPEQNAALLDMRRSNEKLVSDMAALQKEREADRKRADDAERQSIVNTALSGFHFATDAARQTAVEKIMPQIKRTDTGALVAGENLTPEAFIKDFLPTQHAYLLAPVNASGSGVTGGHHGAQGVKAVDTDSIKPGMSAEDKQAAWQAVLAALPK